MTSRTATEDVALDAAATPKGTTVEELTRRYPELEMAGPPVRRPLLVLRGFDAVPVRAPARSTG